jgi:hypothetical protein
VSQAVIPSLLEERRKQLAVLSFDRRLTRGHFFFEGMSFSLRSLAFLLWVYTYSQASIGAACVL